MTFRKAPLACRSARLSGRKAGRLPIAGLGSCRGFFGFALELQGGRHGRYSDRPISAVEVYVGTRRVLIGGPGRLPGHLGSMELVKPCMAVGSMAVGSFWQQSGWPPTAAEMRNKLSPIVTFRAVFLAHAGIVNAPLRLSLENLPRLTCFRAAAGTKLRHSRNRSVRQSI